MGYPIQRAKHSEKAEPEGVGAYSERCTLRVDPRCRVWPPLLKSSPQRFRRGQQELNKKQSQEKQERPCDVSQLNKRYENKEFVHSVGSRSRTCRREEEEEKKRKREKREEDERERERERVHDLSFNFVQANRS